LFFQIFTFGPFYRVVLEVGYQEILANLFSIFSYQSCKHFFVFFSYYLYFFFFAKVGYTVACNHPPNQQLGMGYQEVATVEGLADQSPSGRGTSLVTSQRYPQLKDNSNCPQWMGHIWTHPEQGLVVVIQRLFAEEQT
jgi:hypothetical protein